MAQQQQQQHPITGPISGSGPGGFHFMNSPYGDTTFTKVFVGGLAWETQSETMGLYFEQFGDILEAVVITDKHTGRSKGYGFVTFRDPESARRACVDPTPIIDGRRANCNLASHGRPRPVVPFGLLRSPAPYNIVGMPAARGAYPGNYGYQQPVAYGFQQGLMYSPYGSRYAAYSPEYAYSQNVYNTYGSQQLLQIYGVPGTVGTTMYPYSQLIHGSHGYTPLPGYVMPGQQIVQFGGPSPNVITTTSSLPTIQPPYQAAGPGAIPQQPQFMPGPGGGPHQRAGFA